LVEGSELLSAGADDATCHRNPTVNCERDHLRPVTTRDDQGQQPPFERIGVTYYSTSPYGSLSKFMSLMTAFWAT
jgi:hypothetical protein